jgi:hypothetical protein
LRFRKTTMSNKLTLDHTLKLCRTCDTVKPLDAFHKWKLGRDGKQTRCKACFLVYCGEHRLHINEASAAYREKNRELIREQSRARLAKEKAVKIEAAQ